MSSRTRKTSRLRARPLVRAVSRGLHRCWPARLAAQAELDSDIWWIDLGFLPAPLAQALLAVSGLLLLAFVWRPAVRGWRGWATTATCALLAAIAVANGVVFYLVWRRAASDPTCRCPSPL